MRGCVNDKMAYKVHLTDLFLSGTGKTLKKDTENVKDVQIK